MPISPTFLHGRGPKEAELGLPGGLDYSPATALVASLGDGALTTLLAGVELADKEVERVLRGHRSRRV